MRPGPILRVVLSPLSVVYGAIVRTRAWLYASGILKQKRLNGVVISVGNLTVGGTGKTPMVAMIVERLLTEGKRVGILTRGYRGRAARAEEVDLLTSTYRRRVRDRSEKGIALLVEQGSSMASGSIEQHDVSSTISSDEIDLYRAKFGKQVMIGIGADRFAVGELLERDGINCFVLDDGFQHFRLARDLNIVLVDSTTSLSSALLLPAGSFREPLTALSRADLVILTRTDSGNAPQLSAKIKAYTKAPIFLASTELLEIYQATPNKLTKQAGVTVGKEIHSSQFLLQRMTCNNTKVFAFCAIGNPEAFYSDLKRWGLEVVGKAAYRDHHQYSRKDLETLRRNAESSGAEVLICTEKDILNLNLSSSLGVFGKMPLLTASIGMRLEKPEQFWEMFHRLIASPTSGGPQ